MADNREIRVPDIGDFTDVDVIEVLVSPGDRVEVEDGLIVLETDKASMDVPSDAAGVIRELRVSVGDKVSEGDVIAVLETAGEQGDDGREEADDSEERGVEDAVEGAGDADAPDTAGDDGPQESEDESRAADDGGDTVVQQARSAIKVPDLGDFDEVDVIEVHVSPGDEIQVDDPLLTLETDKASMDVPATAAGKVGEVHVKVGDKVSAGDEILVLLGSSGTARGRSGESEGGAGETPGRPESAESETESATEPERKPAPAPAPERRESKAAEPAPAIDEAGFSRAHASPSVRKLARELGVDLARVEGSGKKGRILAGDVKAWVKKTLAGDARSEPAASALPAVPEVDFAKFGEIELQPLGRIRKISARRLQAAWVNLPHVTQHDLADITELEARRQELKGPAAEKGIRLTPLAFIIKACVNALQEFPRFNASLHPDGEQLVMKRYFHVGFAADTPNGLVVPVIRDADRKDIYELASELASLSDAARNGKLSAEQMQGGTFTVSSLGGIGGTAFTPIINAPEVAILGVSRSAMQPVWNGKEFKPRLMLPLSLSYDHRVIDGADAVRFTTWLAGALGDVSSLLEAIP